MNEAVFCQITRRSITTEVCVKLQHGHDPAACFGCGACSRLCMVCRIRKPVNPEIGLCTACIANQLQTEQDFSLRPFKKSCTGMVYCQIVKKDISAATCFVTQGDEGCNQCPSLFRLCEQCKKQKAFYPQYGLCLTCALEKYAPVWLKVDLKDLSALADLVCAPNDHMGNLLDHARDLVVNTQFASAPLLQEKLGVSHVKATALLNLLELEGVVDQVHWRRPREVLHSPTTTERSVLKKTVMCEYCLDNEAHIRIEDSDVCITCARQTWPNSWTLALGHSRYRKRALEVLMREARDLARENTLVTYRLVENRLKVGREVARNIVRELEREGVLEAFSPRLFGRKTQKIPADISPNPPSPSLCSRCKKRAHRVMLRGMIYCLPCARKQAPSWWTWAINSSPYKDEILQELLTDARTAFHDHVYVTAALLQRSLLVGRSLADDLLRALANEGTVSSRITRIKGHHVQEQHQWKDFGRSDKVLSGPKCNDCHHLSWQIIIRRQKLCISCARKKYGRQWCRVIAYARDPTQIINTLAKEALRMIKKIEPELISATFLRRELMIGRPTANKVIQLLKKKNVLKRKQSSIQGRKILNYGKGPTT